MASPSSINLLRAALATSFLFQVSCQHSGQTDNTNDSAIQLFAGQVKPILERNCLHCHDGKKPSGDLDLSNRQVAFRSSPNGPFFVPGKPDESKVFRVIKLTDREPGAMPPTGHGLTKAQIEILKTWISQGAHWPEGAPGELSASRSTHPRST